MSRTATLPRRAAPLIAAVLGLAMLPAPAHADPSAANLDRRLRIAAHQLEIVVEQFNDVREDLRSTNAQSRALGTRMVPLEQDVRERSDRMGELAASTYRRAGGASAAALLVAGSPQEFVGQLLVLDRLARQRERAVNDLTNAHDRFAIARRTLAALADQQLDQQQRLAAHKTRIEREITRLRAMRHRAAATGLRLVSHADAGPRVPPPYLPGAAGRAVAFAFGQLGKPYRWGADGPDAYDCSGLTSAAWARAGVRLPHSARSQWGAVAHVGRGQLRPGDLVFYYGGISHVALYIGGGRMIHAPQYGEPVRIDSVNYQPVHGYGRPG